MNIAALERDLEATRKEGLDLLEATSRKCEAEKREYTDDERAALEKIRDNGLALKARITRAQGDQAMTEEINRLAGATGTSPATATQRSQGRLLSLGEQFVRAPEYEFFRKQMHRTSSAWRSPSLELDPGGSYGGVLRAATLTEDPASGGALVIPQYVPGIQQLPQKRLVVADLLASGTTDSNLVAYMREKAIVNAANTVLEGAAKPESTLTFEAANDPVRKIATWLPVTEEMLEDVPQIRSYIDQRLQLFVQIEEEDQLLNGTGVAPDLLGLLLRPGLAPDVAAGAGTNADAILVQIMAIFGSSFLMPDGITINPVNWVNVLLTREGGTTGPYLTGGPFSPIQTPTLWGLPAAVTPSIVAGTSLVGAYKAGAQVFRKGGIRVEASNSHADYFIKNLVAIRAEERLALAVYRPGAFGKVTGLKAGPPVVE